MKLQPFVAGLLALIVGWCLLGAGIYLMAGLAAALICAAVLFIGLAFFIFRGLTRARAEQEPG